MLNEQWVLLQPRNYSPPIATNTKSRPGTGRPPSFRAETLLSATALNPPAHNTHFCFDNQVEIRKIMHQQRDTAESSSRPSCTYHNEGIACEFQSEQSRRSSCWMRMSQHCIVCVDAPACSAASSTWLRLCANRPLLCSTTPSRSQRSLCWELSSSEQKEGTAMPLPSSSLVHGYLLRVV